MFRWVKKALLLIKPPKKGDVYYGDAFEFVTARPVEKILHGMKDKHGDTLWIESMGHGTYKITIESSSMPYYICKAEVLVQSKKGYDFTWLTRVQPRRIVKGVLTDMIADGRIDKDAISPKYKC